RRADALRARRRHQLRVGAALMRQCSTGSTYGAQPLPADFAEALDHVQSRLGHIASTVLYFPTIGSTNDVASTLADIEGLVAIADEQTAGRGRRGRTWFSPS